MTFTRKQQKTVLIALIAALVVLNAYNFMTKEPPKTASLTYTRGAVAHTAVREGLAAAASGADPLNVFIARREERFPGVNRDIFRMENPAATKPKSAPPPIIVSPLPPPPAVPERTPEEIAADLARADLSKFRFLGYLTDKDNTLFLSKEGELFIVKAGDVLLKNYKIKEAGKDYVILLDTTTRVEVRVELSGGDQAPPQLQQPQPPPPMRRSL